MNKVKLSLPPIPRQIALSLAILWVFIISIGVGVFIYGQTVMTKRDEANQLESIVTDLQTQEKILHKNNSLSESEVDEFNVVSSKLVPSEESYFSLINALEEISQKSGFELSNYNIDLSSGTQDKIAISVEGNGSIESFLKFLQLYNFSGGRLVTVEQFDVPFQDQQSYNLVLNFYHTRGKKTAQNTNSSANFIPEVQAAPAITDKDLTFIKTVLEQTR